MAGGDVAIAPVVARTGHDSDAAVLHAAGDVSHRAPGVLHKTDAGDDAGDRQTIRFGHLGSREQFKHRKRAYPTRPKPNKSN